MNTGNATRSELMANEEKSNLPPVQEDYGEEVMWEIIDFWVGLILGAVFITVNRGRR